MSICRGVCSMRFAFMSIASGDFYLRGCFFVLESLLPFLTTEVSKGANFVDLFFSSLDQEDHTTEELHCEADLASDSQ
jgi:hypothetical protein